MVSHQLLKLEQSIHNLSLEDKLWLLDKIFEQVRGTTKKQEENNNQQNFSYDTTAKPIWEIAIELGAKIPDSEWQNVPSDLSKNFDSYQK